MGRYIICFAILASLCASCVSSCRDTTLYQRSGRQKAIVAVLPVIDNTQGMDLSWDFSREFTDEIRNRAYDSTQIYLLRDHGSREMAVRLNTPNPSAIPAEAAQDLGAAEFVVVSELIDHSNANAEDGLKLSMRVRVLDVRNDQPKVILQEILNNHHVMAAAPYMTCDYEKMGWGSEAYERTPLGMAHGKLVRTLVSRVESYIEASR